jgi:hypothetical protein
MVHAQSGLASRNKDKMFTNRCPSQRRQLHSISNDSQLDPGAPPPIGSPLRKQQLFRLCNNRNMRLHVLLLFRSSRFYFCLLQVFIPPFLSLSHSAHLVFFSFSLLCSLFEKRIYSLHIFFMAMSDWLLLSSAIVSVSLFSLSLSRSYEADVKRNTFLFSCKEYPFHFISPPPYRAIRLFCFIRPVSFCLANYVYANGPRKLNTHRHPGCYKIYCP